MTFPIRQQAEWTGSYLLGNTANATDVTDAIARGWPAGCGFHTKQAADNAWFLATGAEDVAVSFDENNDFDSFGDLTAAGLAKAAQITTFAAKVRFVDAEEIDVPTVKAVVPSSVPVGVRLNSIKFPESPFDPPTDITIQNVATKQWMGWNRFGTDLRSRDFDVDYTPIREASNWYRARVDRSFLVYVQAVGMALDNSTGSSIFDLMAPSVGAITNSVRRAFEQHASVVVIDGWYDYDALNFNDPAKTDNFSQGKWQQILVSTDIYLNDKWRDNNPNVPRNSLVCAQ